MQCKYCAFIDYCIEMSDEELKSDLKNMDMKEKRKMNFETFVDEVKKKIKEYLPDQYDQADIQVEKQQKLNETYTGLIVKKPEQRVTPSINLNQMYDAYETDDMTMDELLERIAYIVQVEPCIDVDEILDYDKAKDRLFIRVASVEANKDMLANVPHKTYEDLALTYHIALDIEGEGDASAVVTNQLMELYGITAEQLHQDAMATTEHVMPARVESLAAVVRRMLAEEMLDTGLSQEEVEMITEGIDDSNTMIVVSSEKTFNGAAVMFYPGMMDKISERMQGDYYILPSSVHEMIVIPDDVDMNHEEMKEMVTAINATQLMPADSLTDEVYHYDAKKRIFKKL